MKPVTVLRWILAILLLAAIAAGLAFLPVRDTLRWFRHLLPALGIFGPVVLVLADAVVCVVFLPGSAVTLLAGYLYGTAGGTLIALIGSALGASAAFFISRFMVRAWIEARMAGHPAFKAIDRAIAGEGFKIVLLCRLCSLIPFDLTSYMSGITEISFRRYLLATVLGRLPETLMFAYIGGTAKHAHELAAGRMAFGPAQKIYMALGVLAMVAVTVVIGRIARNALREAVDRHDDSEKP